MAQSPTSERYWHASAADKCFFAARRMRSSTCTPLNRTGCWNAKLIPIFARSVMLMSVMSLSSKKIWPAVGFMIPAMSFASVDLPPPLGPVITTNL